MSQLTNRDKAENLWQLLNALLIAHNPDTSNMLEIEFQYLQRGLEINRPNSEETQIDQDNLFAKKVLNELPLSSGIPLVNRLMFMCKDELDIED